MLTWYQTTTKCGAVCLISIEQLDMADFYKHPMWISAVVERENGFLSLSFFHVSSFFTTNEPVFALSDCSELQEFVTFNGTLAKQHLASSWLYLFINGCPMSLQYNLPLAVYHLLRCIFFGTYFDSVTKWYLIMPAEECCEQHNCT